MTAKTIRVAIAVLIVGAVVGVMLLPIKRPLHVRIVLPPVSVH